MQNHNGAMKSQVFTARFNKISKQEFQMESHIFDITILCSVVDNFGDIGVCWRLAKHLNEIRLKDSDFPKKFTLRFVCDNLVSFSKINSKINPEKSFQECDGIQIYSWNDYDLCYKSFTENEPEIILECFQCGQPDWMEKILFEDRVEHIVNIFMIDYLCAEKWVDDFHCLKSLTRTALVQKVNFMQGFTTKTGGLLLPERSRNKFGMTDGMFDLTDSHAELVSASVLRKRDRPTRMLFFAYERDWTCVVRAIKKAFSKKEKISNNQRDDIIIKIAGGAGQQSIL